MKKQRKPYITTGRALTINLLKDDSSKFVMLKNACKETGLPLSVLRTQFPTRKFGNTEYVNPKTVNKYIECGVIEQE